MPDDIQEIVPGLWRWTAPHPDWRPSESPDAWDQTVGSVLYTNDEQAVFIDPLLPSDPGPFWAWADARVKARSARPGRRRDDVLAP